MDDCRQLSWLWRLWKIEQGCRGLWVLVKGRRVDEGEMVVRGGGVFGALGRVGDVGVEEGEGGLSGGGQ